ncbi:FMN-binding glutamate synthase family protein [Candidatus Sororendozoicomonas aggregata]|uniref:FMN-binding glutamate synthase family protein n=1 Tax=Candidatus Sororendozoicomonas aggregata TaxID=3073239 RepID=UPI002ED2A741
MTVMQRVLWLVTIPGNLAGIMAWELGFSPWWLVLTVTYTLVGSYDYLCSHHTLNRLYPVVAYIRYVLEFIRPEIRQYFIASNTDEKPFNREMRSLIYQRAKAVRDTKAFGTERNLYERGFLSANHALVPVVVCQQSCRVTVGGTDCLQPYSASRLNISAMSYGALSANAIRALNGGAMMGGFAHNTGEGGISPYHLEAGGDLIWQIGSGYFGCRDDSGNFCPESFKENARRAEVKMIEIKLSQGAKPGHGGVLPAAKITQEVSEIRGIPMGQDCISPAAHSAFHSPKGLLKFIKQLRELSEGKPVGFKLCVGRKEDVMAIIKAMLEMRILPDFITVDGAEGGTGAAPVELTNHMGLPCIEGTYFLHNCLVGARLRKDIRIISSGITASGFNVLTKLAVGADMVNAARSMMMAMGCIQSRACNTNHCPTGIATQDPVRSKALNVTSKRERVAHYHKATMESCFSLIGAMGINDVNKLCPSHILQRTHDGLAVPFDSIHPSLKEGELLGKKINDSFSLFWERASADSFKAISEVFHKQ